MLGAAAVVLFVAAVAVAVAVSMSVALVVVDVSFFLLVGLVCMITVFAHLEGIK